MTRLALLRHGHTDWNRAGRIQGRSDIPLDEQARATLSRMTLPAPWDAADLVASPLLRATETAEIVGKRAPAVDARLIEMDWGDWEGQRGEDLRADPESGYRDIEDWGLDFRPPQGESVAEVQARAVAWANELTRETVAVCHIGIMRMLMAYATGWKFKGPAPFAIKRNRLFVIDFVQWRFEGIVRLGQVTQCE